jgi:hypothetical protein
MSIATATQIKELVMTGLDEPRDVIVLLERADPTAGDESPHEVDEAQLAAAHARVMQMLAAEDGGGRAPDLPSASPRSRRIRWTRGSAAIVGLAAAASAVLLALPAHNISNELSLVNAAAKVAASQPPATAVPPGRYFHMLVRSFRDVTGTGVSNDSNIEYWVGADGSGLVRQGVARSVFPGHRCPPPAPPPPGYLSITCATSANMVMNDFRLGPRGFYTFSGDYIETWVRSLPTDEHALEAALQKRWTREYSNIPGVRVGRADSPQLLGLIGDALGDPLTSPAVRSSLFRLAGTLPGVSVRTGVKDAYGRTGTEISATGATGVALPSGSPSGRNGTRAQRQILRLIFDPATSQLLDSDSTLPRAGSQGTVLLAYFDRGIVGSLPASGDRSPR